MALQKCTKRTNFMLSISRRLFEKYSATTLKDSIGCNFLNAVTLLPAWLDKFSINKKETDFLIIKIYFHKRFLITFTCVFKTVLSPRRGRDCFRANKGSFNRQISSREISYDVFQRRRTSHLNYIYQKLPVWV